jgi:hypothetical protein
MAAHFCQVVGDAAPDNASADNDYFSGVHLFLQELHSSGAEVRGYIRLVAFRQCALWLPGSLLTLPAKVSCRPCPRATGDNP